MPDPTTTTTTHHSTVSGAPAPSGVLEHFESGARASAIYPEAWERCRTSVPLAEVERLHLEPGDLVIIRCPASATVDQAQAAWYGVREWLAESHPDVRALVVHDGWQVSGASRAQMVAGLERALAAGAPLEPAERAAVESLLDAIRACR